MSGGSNGGIRPGYIGHLSPISGPFAAGKAAGLSGAEESSDPHHHPSIASADWLRGHAEGKRERVAAFTASRRSSARSTNGPDPETNG